MRSLVCLAIVALVRGAPINDSQDGTTPEPVAPEAAVSEVPASERPSSEVAESLDLEAPAPKTMDPEAPSSETIIPETHASAKPIATVTAAPFDPEASTPWYVSFIDPEINPIIDTTDQLLWAVFGDVDEGEYLRLSAAKDAASFAVNKPVQTGQMFLIWGDVDENEYNLRNISASNYAASSAVNEPIQTGGSIFMMWGD